jgi:hypothetical protein
MLVLRFGQWRRVRFLAAFHRFLDVAYRLCRVRVVRFAAHKPERVLLAGAAALLQWKNVVLRLTLRKLLSPKRQNCFAARIQRDHAARAVPASPVAACNTQKSSTTFRLCSSRLMS